MGWSQASDKPFTVNHYCTQIYTVCVYACLGLPDYKYFAAGFRYTKIEYL